MLAFRSCLLVYAKEILKGFFQINCRRMSKISLWDMKEDIGYVDELDVAIVKAIETQS